MPIAQISPRVSKFKTKKDIVHENLSLDDDKQQDRASYKNIKKRIDCWISKETSEL